MATILTQPDALSLSSNLKKFEISTLLNITFKLYKGELLLLDEAYSPSPAGNITIDVASIVNSCLSFSLPTTDVFVQNSVLGNFVAHIDNITVPFKVIRAGVENLSETPSNFFTSNFLTWQPQVKAVSYIQPEWLSYYAVVASKLKVRLYFTDDSSSVFQIADLTAGNCYSFNMQMQHIFSLSPIEKYGSFDVWVEDNQGNRLTYVQRYTLADSYTLDDVFLFENSLGGIDTVCLQGAHSFVPESTYSVAEYSEIYSQLDGIDIRYYGKNSGIKSKQEITWLWDFVKSKGYNRYFLDKGIIKKIVLSSSEIKDTSLDDVKSFEIKYRYAADSGLLNNERFGELPPVLQIPADGQLFFLAPRLVEFPAAEINDALLFPVQSPFSETWQKISFGALAEKLGSLPGGSVKEVYQSTINLPTIGKENILYIVCSNEIDAEIYIYENGQYRQVTWNYNNINIINGGQA